MASGKATSSILMLVMLLCCMFFRGGDGCTLPDELVGTWYDSVKGPLTFTNTTITGFDIHTFGTFDLSCYQQNGSTYILESGSFTFFSLNFQAYICWTFTKVSDDLFYFYENSVPLQDAGYEKVKMYLPFSVRNYSEVCANTNPGLGTYRVLYKNNTLSASAANTTCPTFLQSYHTFEINVNGTDVCTSTGSLDGCASTSTLAVNDGNCSTTLGYSADGDVSCLLHIVSGNTNYITVVNNDATVDGNFTFLLTCMIIDTSSTPYTASQFPTQCPDDMNDTYVAAPGGLVSMTFTSVCPTSTTSLLWIIAVVLIPLLVIAMLVVVALYRNKKQKKEEQKKLDEQRACDNTRYTEDDTFTTRGSYPPSVTITIMEGRSRGKKDLIVEDKDKEKDKDKASFTTNGEVTPSLVQPSYDAPHRRFSKRRRVWVIGDDGKVLKSYKERKDGKDGKDSPDSGMEEEDENKTSKTGGSAVTRDGDKQQQQQDFLKQYGRQDVRAADELEDKGDMNTSKSKLFTKIKKMAGIKSFAKARKQRAKAEKSAKMYKHAGGSGHGGDQDGDGSDDSNDNKKGLVLGEKERNSLKALSAAQKQQHKEGTQKTGDKGRHSPDSGTGRDSALSSHSSASTYSFTNNNDNDQGRDGSAGNRKDKGSGGGLGGSGGGSGGGGGGEGTGSSGGGRGSSFGGDRHPGSEGGPGDTSHLAMDGVGRGGDSASNTHPGSERSGRSATRVSRSRSDRYGFGNRSEATHPSSSSSFRSREGDITVQDISEQGLGEVTGPKRGKSGKGRGTASSGQDSNCLGLGHANVIQVTPRGGPDSSDISTSQRTEDQQQDSRHRTREDSLLSAINLNHDNGATGVHLEASRPPTGHQRRHGWQEGDSSRSPSRSRSRSPGRGLGQQQQTDGQTRTSDEVQSLQDRASEHRGVRWQGDESTTQPSESGRRSVRWMDGSSQGDSWMVPVTPGMGIRRYVDSVDGTATPTRENRAYSSMSRLARIHRKKKVVAPMLNDPSVQDEIRKRGLQRPPDMDDLAWKRLLEELYPDKKYLDYAKATSQEHLKQEDEFLQAKAGEGLGYLYQRAKYWENQEPLVRPGTTLSMHSVDSRAPSAVPPSSRAASRAGNSHRLL